MYANVYNYCTYVICAKYNYCTYVICAKIAIINNYNSCNRLTETFSSKRTLRNSMLVHNKLLSKGKLLVNMLGIFTVGKKFSFRSLCNKDNLLSRSLFRHLVSEEQSGKVACQEKYCIIYEEKQEKVLHWQRLWGSHQETLSAFSIQYFCYTLSFLHSPHIKCQEQVGTNVTWHVFTFFSSGQNTIPYHH